VLSLAALFGMIVLAVDVGSLLLTRVAAQNAADAGALAAAISCGKSEGMTAADSEASFYASGNLSGSLVAAGYPTYFPMCDAPSGRVTVRVEIDRDLYFAPALGFAPSSPVRAQATAVWGGAGAFEHVAPLMVSADRLQDAECDVPPDEPVEGVEYLCSFWWNNSSAASTDPDLTNAEWGTLDLLKWNVDPSIHCDNSTPPEFEEWMLTGYPGELPIDPDGTTYVCRGQGNFGNALTNDLEEAMEQGLLLYFPVNDPATQIDASGNVCPPFLPEVYPEADGSCTVDKYNIIGFVQMRITGVYKGNSDEAASFCDHVPEFDADPNSRCLTLVWTKYTTEGLNSQGGENFGLVPVELIE
jgi:hypothetical protein